MKPQQTQPKTDPNLAGANLGFVNTLQEHLLQYKAKQGQTSQSTPPTPQVPPPQDPNQEVPSNQQNQTDTNNQIQGLESRLMDELATVKAELQSQKEGKKEFDDLKKQIETILNSTD